MSKLYLGLDVHKDSITIAIAEPGPKGEVRLYGSISNELRIPQNVASNRCGSKAAHLDAQLPNVNNLDATPFPCDPCDLWLMKRWRGA